MAHPTHVAVEGCCVVVQGAKRAAPAQLATGQQADRAAAAANRAKAVRLKQPSYVVPYKTERGEAKEKVMWLATGNMPAMMDRGVDKVDGARVLQRPSKKAYALGVRDVRDRARVAAKWLFWQHIRLGNGRHDAGRAERVRRWLDAGADRPSAFRI